MMIEVTQEPEFLLCKRGLYYRPERRGYTGIKDYAGLYLESEASPPDVVAIHESQAAEFSPSCFDDLARDHLRKQRDDAIASTAALAERVKVLSEALQGIDIWLSDTLSGRVKPDPKTYRQWLIDGIIEARNRARKALEQRND